uniref:Vacuolar protein sorting 37 homolog C n=1 Tax=Iconisemion striatum TaxID=60296 RepID=A0A1A7XJC9_9TELE
MTVITAAVDNSLLNTEASAIPANQMEKLQDLSQSELQELLDEPDRVESMALESDEIQNIQLEREMALASNRSLAEQNLDMKPHLESKKEVLVARYCQLEMVRETYRQHCSLRDGMVGQVSPEALFPRLQTETGETEAESEALADEFLDGSLPLDSFLERFLLLRSLAHKRRVQIEKLQELLRQKNESSSTTMTSSACVNPSPVVTQSPWNQQTTTATTTDQQQPNSKPQSCSYQHGSQPAPSAGGSSGLPYSQYPVTTPNPPSTGAAVCSVPNNPPSQFPPYPSSGLSFTPAGSYSGPRPAFMPAAPITCPYPNQPSFPAPHPGSAFGQYIPSNPSSGTTPYPASYSYGGYSYPAGPPYSNSQSPSGRPIYRPGFGVPQPYS